jgi:hypothetical protein
MGASPDQTITVYRGAPKSQNKISPGDFITTNKQLAQDYAGNGHVISQEVRASDILDDITEPIGEEYIYRPTKSGKSDLITPFTKQTNPLIEEAKKYKSAEEFIRAKISNKVNVFEDSDEAIANIQGNRHLLHSLDSEKQYYSDGVENGMLDEYANTIADEIEALNITGKESEISKKIRDSINDERKSDYDLELDDSLDENTYSTEAVFEINAEKEKINKIVEDYLESLDQEYGKYGLDPSNTSMPLTDRENRPFKPTGFARARSVLGTGANNTAGKDLIPDAPQDNISKELTDIYNQANSLITPFSKKTQFDYKPSQTLDAKYKSVEQKFGDYLKNNTDKALADYQKEFGNVINTDNARELSPDYKANRSELSAAVHEPASALMKKLYEQKLAEGSHDFKDIIVFTAGGTGAGKSTAIKDIPAVQNIVNNASLIYDTNMNKYDSAVKKINQASKAGKKVSIVYVYSDIIKAFGNAVNRAQRMGRTVPIAEHIKTHLGSLEVIKKLSDEFKDNPNVDIRYIDNSGGKGEAKEVDIDNINTRSYNQSGKELEDEIRQQLEKFRGSIKESVYNGFKGGVGKTDFQRAVRPNGAGNGREPQLPYNSRRL